MNPSAATDTGRLQAHIEAYSMLRQMFKAALSGEIDASARAFQAGESRSTIHWLVGHVTWAMDRVGRGPFGLKPELPAEYDSLFGMGTTPDPQAAGYPPLEKLMREFDASVEGLAEKIATLNDGDLDRPMPEDSPAKVRFPTLGALLHGTYFHTAYHLGQVSMLRCAKGLPSGFGV
jgi:hypothetical protein